MADNYLQKLVHMESCDKNVPAFLLNHRKSGVDKITVSASIFIYFLKSLILISA